ncbi:ABC transporter substrate-binding protein [Streptacidiphilus jiangxiensis]|uniref:Peptide/nickel transport system substrate-binding protein n=1 Tax=Streptacidiphilus jiangxiensis TaxID=235985 RepID=A0A1H7ZHP7_STRJI|nr:ABC transporter substrate-binding protein [Streptacidiphilus jiangxiensis]SEM57783.1 peptide/nickel transport system substrate-binding protein [Streptacidiphilus jiangxiensis]
MPRTTHRTRTLALGAVLTSVALAAAGCTSGSSPKPGGQNSPGTSADAANVNGGGTPVKGGTLKLLGNSDVDHLDTASAYYSVSYVIERAYARQLFTYPAATDPNKVNAVVPDLATELPTAANGGISADGLTYTIHLRQGPMWNTTPARAVTAQDEVLGMKRLCNPTQNSVGAPSYYEGVIKGFSEYCAGFAKVKQTIPDMKAYITGHDISGVTAVDANTVRFTLVKPASDFLNILAMPFSSPAPVEYLNYMPDDANFRQHTISDGPYQITSYTPSQSIKLDRNPAWTKAADPVRDAYVDHIQVTEGPDEAAVQQQIQAGTADMEWDTSVPTASIPALRATKDPRLGIYTSGISNPFLIFNFQSPNNGGALAKPAVRQALEYAIDKVAIGQIYGGPSLNTPLDQTLPPGSLGYQQMDPYATPGSKGDAAKCKSMLAAAGYPNGLQLTDLVRNAGKHPAVAQSVQTDLKACGVTVTLDPVPQGDYYGKYLGVPAIAKAGKWDISEPGWIPDWFGNNGRSTIEPLFDGRTYGPGATDWGDVNDAQVNALIDQALAASDETTAAGFWHQADQRLMAIAAIVPFESQSTPVFRSDRVHNAIFEPFSQQYDVNEIWLSPNS